jgi:hypothetical protein
MFLVWGFLVLRGFDLRMAEYEGRNQMENSTGLDFSEALELRGYFVNARDTYSWIRFNISEEGLDRFFQRNNLDENLLRREAPIEDVVPAVMPGSHRARAKEIDWILEGGVLLRAYRIEHLSVVVGKHLEDSEILTVYISQ